jgi:hypothetical protein
MELDLEILKELRVKEKRSSEIQKKLYPIFKSSQLFHKLAEETFRTQLNRTLHKLTECEEIERIDRGHQNVSYSISSKGKQRLIALDISAYVSELDKQNLEIWYSVLSQIRERQNDPSCYCFTFIDDVPVTFSKSIEALQSHLDRVRRLQISHSKEIERIRNEVYQVVPGEPITFWKEEWSKFNDRVEKEVGWRLGDYFRKLVKMAENMEFEESLILMGVIDEPTNNEEKDHGKNEK